MLKNDLTRAEMMVMKIIWEAPEHLVLSQVVEQSNEQFHNDWKPQTVSTYLAHLVRKGYLKMHRSGKIYTYEPLKDKDAYMREQLLELCRWYAEDKSPVEIAKKLLLWEVPA